jgi:flagellar basal-body rod protein FlgF
MSQLLLSSVDNAKQIMQAQAVNANNLANISTDGFKSELAVVTASAEGGQTFSASDLSAGVVRSTGRSLDIAVHGEGWIAVVGADGTEGYSRRGDLHVDLLGQVIDGAGRQVMGNAGPMVLPPFSAIEIAGDGTISIMPEGSTADTMAVVDRIKLVEPEKSELQRSTDGLMRLPDGQIADASANIRISSGSLEGSNVNAVAEMVKMIDLARRFEGQVKLMQTAQENDKALAEVMSMR